MAENDGRYGFGVTLTDESVKRVAEEVKKEFQGMSQSAAQEGAKMESSFRKIGTALGVGFSLKAAADFGKQIVKVRGEIESLEVSFKTLLGDEKKAVALMADIRKFAASTPMQMNDLAAGAQTLLGFNIEAEKVMPTLQALGDISMGDSQKFNSLTLAFAQMSSTGKLMGQDLLQMINAGFNPLVQIAERTGKSVGELKEEMSQGKISVDMVTQAFMDATAEGGKFHGMLEKQSQGIQGSLSNVQGALNDMLNDLGEKIQEPVTDGLHLLQRLIQHYEEVGKVIGVLVATYGGYKAAVMAYNAAMVVATNLTKGYTVAQQIEYVWLLLVEKAQNALNKTMLKNPFILAATALIALVSALVLLKKRTSEAEKAQNALNNAVDGSKKRSDDLKQETNDLIAVLDDETATEAQHKEALDKLIATYPELLKDCKTYNDYLEHREAILEGMPKAQEEKENETLRESIDLMEEYTKVKKDAYYKNGESYQQHDERINNEYGSYQKQYEKEQELRMKLDKEYQEWKEAGNKGTLDEYVRLSLEANKKVLNDRIKTQQQAAFEAKPIEERIEITETSIKQVEASITFLKRKAEAEPWNPTLQLDLSIAEGQLQQLQNQLDNLTAQKPMPVKIDFGKAVRDAERALDAARRNYRADASETNKKAVTDAEANVDTAKKNYKNAYGKDYDQAVKAGQDRAKARKEANAELKKEEEAFAKWLVKQARQQGFDEEQARIDGMKDGFAKEQAQLELSKKQRLAAYDDYREELLEKVRDLAEAQWKAQNPDKVKAGEKFDRSSASIGDPNKPTERPTIEGLDYNANTQVFEAILNAHKLLRREEQNIEAQNANDQQALLDKQLAGIKTYLQQREAIEKEYAAKREALYEAGTVTKDENGRITGGNLKQGVTQGNVSELDRQEQEALKGVDEQFAQRSEQYQAWCDAVASLTLEQLEALLIQAQAELASIEGSGEVDQQKLAEARARVDTLEKSIKKLNAQSGKTTKKMQKEWAKLSPEFGKCADALGDLGDVMSDSGNEAVAAAGQYVKAASSILKSGQSAVDAIMEATSGTVSAIQTTAQGATTAMATTAEGAAGAIKMVETASVVLTVISAALSIAMAIVNLVKSSKQKKHEELLESINNQIDELNSSYDDLGKQAERTFGASNAEIRSQQIELKKAQIELLKTAIAEEKAQKKPDNDKIKEWEKQINAINKEIDDLGESAVDAIYGEDIKSAIENFGDALIEAWEGGKSASQSANDYMRNMIKKTVTQAILDYTQASQKIEAIRAKLKEYLENDGIIDENEKADLEGMAQRLMEEVEDEFEWAQSLFDESSRNASRRGIATASQESVDELNGRMTAVQGHTFNISENSNVIRSTIEAIYGCVQRIEYNTERLHSIKSSIDDIQIHGVRIRQ